MRGDCRHHYLTDQNFVSVARTTANYRLYNLGTYPGLVEADHDGLAIYGELWKVSPECLAVLDEVEGVDDALYERRAINLIDPEIKTPVESYFYLGPVTGKPDVGDRWIVQNNG